MNYFHSLLTKITGNRFARLQRRDTWTNGLRTFGELDVINRPLAKYNASEDKKKKEKSRKKDRVRQNYGFIYRGGIIVSIIFSSWNAYTMTNCLWAIFCFFFSSFYFSSYRRWCSSFLLGLLYMFFFFFLSALVIWYRFIIPCIGSFFIFFFGNVPVLLRVYNPVSPYRSTRPQENRTTWSFMSMWRGWMGQGFSLDYTISLLVFVGFYSFICMRYYESMDE